MSVYPDVQAAAQRELDRALGADRLPDISDRPNLPYMNALCKEVLRWHNAAPTGEPVLRLQVYCQIAQVYRIGLARILSTNAREVIRLF
jgi:cytochrome P450